MKKNRLHRSLASALLAQASEIDVTGFSMSMPLHVLLGEAIDVARFCQQHWEPNADRNTRGAVRPGLALAGEGRLPKAVIDEILVLQELTQRAQTAYVLAIAPPSTGTERAAFVRNELASALSWVCGDGVLDGADAKLVAIVEAHRTDPDSEDALASEIADYLGLATELQGELAKVGAFDPAILEEGQALVLALRERSAVRATKRNGEAGALLTQRNQLAAALMQRIGRVRAAARYVFRHHDAIVKQVTSAYQRHRRAAARRRKTDDAAPRTTTPALTTE